MKTTAQKNYKTMTAMGALAAALLIGGCETSGANLMSTLDNARQTMTGTAGGATNEDGTTGTTGGIMSFLGGMGAGAICNNNSNDSPWCGVAVQFAKMAGKALGDEIEKSMTEKEQRLALQEATAAISTGQPRTLSLPESGGTIKVTPSGNTSLKSVPAEISAYDNVLPALSGAYVVADPKVRSVAATTTVRSTPGFSGEATAVLSSSDIFHTFGSPEDSQWVLVGYRASDFLGDIPVAIGFVEKSALSQSFQNEFTQVKPVLESDKTFQQVELMWLTKCDAEVDVEREKTDGGIASSSAEMCDGPGFETIIPPSG